MFISSNWYQFMSGFVCVCVSMYTVYVCSSSTAPFDTCITNGKMLYKKEIKDSAQLKRKMGLWISSLCYTRRVLMEWALFDKRHALPFATIIGAFAKVYMHIYIYPRNEGEGSISIWIQILQTSVEQNQLGWFFSPGCTSKDLKWFVMISFHVYRGETGLT